MNRIILFFYCSFFFGLKHSERLMAQSPKGFGVVVDNSGAATHKIGSVFAGSPADKAGLKAGDLFISINGTLTKNLDNMAIVMLLRNNDEAKMIIEREGLQKTIQITKVPVYLFDRKCITGNCINGTGKAVILTNKNQVYDGLFKEGIILSGTIYNEDGKVLSSGSYDNKGRIISGYDYIETRGGGYVIFTYLQYDEKGNRLYNGLVKVREKDPVKGRIIMEANFTNGNKNGLVKEWDYPNDVRHEIMYQDGISETGTIYRITDEIIVGRDVKYKPYTSNDDIIDAIHEGKFQFANDLVPLSFKGSGSIKTVKEVYDLTISDLAKSRNTANNTHTAQNKEVTTNSTKFSKEFRDSILKVCHNLEAEGIADLHLATKVVDNANRKNYYSSRLMISNYRRSILDKLDKIDKLIAMLENPADEHYRKEIADIKFQIKNMEIPASAANRKAK